MENVIRIHDGDPNFPFVTLQKIKEFLCTSMTQISLFRRPPSLLTRKPNQPRMASLRTRKSTSA